MDESNEIQRESLKKLSCILDKTTKLDFPFGSSQRIKKVIIVEKKLHMENCIKKIVPEYFPSKDVLEKIWEESVKYADEQFKTLSEKNRLNGFYLQEIMHCYVEKICQEILDNI